MIIEKALIDASINGKRAAQEAHEKAILETIKSKINDVKGLSAHIKEIMDTYAYVKSLDDALGKKLWTVICRSGDSLGLDFCNAIMTIPDGRCGVRPNYAVKGVFGHIYVTSIGVFFGYELDDLRAIDEVAAWLRPLSYDSMLNAITLLLEAVPAYKEKIATELKSML